MREDLLPWEVRQLNARLCARAGLLNIASTHRAGAMPLSGAGGLAIFEVLPHGDLSGDWYNGGPRVSVLLDQN